MTKPDDLNSSLLSGTKRRFISFDKIHRRLSMGARKKSKPNFEAPANDSGSGSTPAPRSSTATATIPENTQKPASESPKETSSVSKDAVKPSTNPIHGQPKSLETQAPRKSWYGAGSWRAKASPVAQVAKEGVTVIGGIPSGSEATKPSAPSLSAPFLAKRRTSKGDPIAASMTKLNVTCNKGDGSQADLEATEAEPEIVTESAPLPPDPTKDGGAGEAEKTQQADSKKQPQASGWRIWWSRPDEYVSSGEDADKSNTIPEDAKTTPLPGLTPMDDPATQKPLEAPVDPDQKQTQQKDTAGKEAEANAAVTDAAGQSKSWFWLWSNTQNTPTSETPAVAEVEAVPPNEEPPPVSQPEEQIPQSDRTLEQTQVDGLVEQHKSDTVTSSNKSSGWAFWSRSTQKSQGDAAQEASHKEVGELAVADTPSQSRPEAAQYNEEEQPQKERPKSIRGKSKEKTTRKKKSVTSAQPAQAVVLPENATAAESAAKITAKTQQPQNLILPEFSSTFSPHQTPSYWQRLRHYIAKHEPGAPHLYIAPPPPKIKKAIAIGIHGYFPAPLIQKVIGQPTGTSIRFANAAAASIEEWTKERGYSCDIEKVALEGEGFIADRVSTLWNLLLNWIDHIKSADFILVACHSQGVPVAVMLVAKLIAFGCVNGAKIGICAMAGVNQGPFAEFKTRFFGGSAAELFEFSRPKSTVSQMYITALEEVLNHGVKIVYVGSLDDQLVSLDSSTFSSISHPYIYRAVFIDGRTQAPDFITGLVSFVLKLRNLGLPDHGLIRELSPALAGSIYSGEGHSRLYEEVKVYKLAIQHALETTSLPQTLTHSSSPASVKLKVKEYDNGANSVATNPFFLPWAMRGILEEDFVKKEMQKEVDELLSMFEAWRPAAKPLKDVRFRLEAVRSKL